MKRKCELILARDGQKVPVVKRDGESYRLGSSYDGAYAAGRWAAFHVPEDAEQVILFGLGDCQIPSALLARVPGRVLVYEPEEAVYHKVKSLPVFKKLQKDRRFYCLCGERQQDVLQQRMIDILNDDCLDRTIFRITPGYLTHYGEEYTVVAQMCQRICEAIQTTQGAIQRSFPTMIKNQLRNIYYLRDAIPLTRMVPFWDKDIPVILVSAGPSLLKNIECLKKAAGRALIFSVDAALPVLLKHGIFPDMAGSIDAVKNMDCFSEPGSYEIPCLVTCNSRYELISQLSGEKIWGSDHGCTRMIMEKYGIRSPEHSAQFGIAGGMFAMLMELGVRKIIMVGQDLAYSEGRRSHIGGQDEGFDETQAILVEGYYGERVYSRKDWNQFRVWFEDAIRSLPSQCEVINATEGGVKIQGTIQLPLQQVLEQLPERQISLSDLFSRKEIRITEEEYGDIIEEWAHVRRDLEQIKEWGYHRLFFQTDYHDIPVMDMVLAAMRYLRDVPDREERFHRAVEFVYQNVLEWEETEGKS